MIESYSVHNKRNPFIIEYDFPVVFDFSLPDDNYRDKYPNTARMSEIPEEVKKRFTIKNLEQILKNCPK